MMDRREAIQELSNLAWVQGGANRDKATEALDLAIEALLADTVHKPDYSYEAGMVRRLKEWQELDREIRGHDGKSICHTCATNNCPFQSGIYRNNCDFYTSAEIVELISKEQAIEVANKIIKEHENRMPKWSKEDMLTSGYDTAKKHGYIADGAELVRNAIENLPSVNQKQITGKLESAETATSEGEESTMGQPKSKLKNPCDSLLKADSDECKEQKSKLDLISRADAVAKAKKKEEAFALKGNIKMSRRYGWLAEKIKALPPVTPKPVCEDAISRQALIDEVLEDGNGAVLSYTEGMDGDELVERIEKQMIKHFIEVIKYAPPVTPTERTGEWTVEEKDSIYGKKIRLTCSECGDVFTVTEEAYPYERYCRYCGAKMKGGTENE